MASVAAAPERFGQCGHEVAEREGAWPEAFECGRAKRDNFEVFGQELVRAAMRSVMALERCTREKLGGGGGGRSNKRS